MKTPSTTISAQAPLDPVALSDPSSAVSAGSIQPLICALAFIAIYVPVILDAAKIWSTNDSYSHGFLVLPCSIAILWLQRDQLKRATVNPTLWGIVPLLIGLLMEVTSYILQVRYVGMWSMVPTLFGAILLLYGPQVWNICQFSVLFTLFASPISNTLLQSTTASLQQYSTIGSTTLMSLVGYTLARHGNVIELPGATLEIADACSGFHSIVSMLAFTSIYAYLFGDTVWKRTILWLVTIPLAMSANILRICVLIAAANYGGMPAYHAFHDPAAIAEILVDFGILILIGRSLGCENLRFAAPSAA